jgi:hypothetical protein
MRTDTPPPTFTLGPTLTTVRAPDGTVHTVPDGWVLVPPGDAALTRCVRLAGESWSVAQKRGRKVFSRGVWTPATTVEPSTASCPSEKWKPTHDDRRRRNPSRRS